MKKKPMYTILFLFIILLLLAIVCSKNKEKTEKKVDHFLEANRKILIKTQLKYKREFFAVSLDSLISINLENLENVLYIPLFCRFDDDGNLFLMDRTTFQIHKFSTNNNWTNYIHSVFGNGKGEGPGEFMNPTDFKVFKNRLFITDQQTGAIEIYSTDGNYLKRITTEARADYILPYQIAPVNENRIIIERRGYPVENLFYICDYNGKIIKGFGKYIDNSNLNNAVYHDNKITALFKGSYFYYLPYYLGFVGLYKDDNLLFARQTVDGLQKLEVVTKKIRDGVVARKLDRKFETAVRHAINEDYIIIQAYDREKKLFFYDIYSLMNFDYIFSVSNFPKTNDFDTKGNLLACTLYNSLNIYNIEKVNSLIREKIEELNSH
ncbi:MAG: 6-bladed beta-propeller [Candidatus Zhuqueibacterota bacterium]